MTDGLIFIIVPEGMTTGIYLTTCKSFFAGCYAIKTFCAFNQQEMRANGHNLRDWFDIFFHCINLLNVAIIMLLHHHLLAIHDVEAVLGFLNLLAIQVINLAIQLAFSHDIINACCFTIYEEL